MQPAEYYGVASARTGGYVIPYIPPPCLIEVDNKCVVPMPDLPTVVVVVMGIAVWVWWFYNQFLAETHVKEAAAPAFRERPCWFAPARLLRRGHISPQK